VFAWQLVLLEPTDQVVCILDGRFAETERVPNLCPVTFDSAPSPVILGIEFWWHTKLLGDMDQDCWRDLAPVLRKPAFVLEVLEEEGVAKARGGPLIGEKCEITRMQCPVLNQLVFRPLPFHSNPS
jgi:hypothetical protein